MLSTPLPVCYELPKFMALDLARPQLVHPYGLHFFIGLPGTGKTMFITKRLEEYRRKYKNEVLIATNYGFGLQDFAISGYSDLLKVYKKPLIVGYDEIQNDFDARQWGTLASGFSERITQSRKMTGLQILATAQKFTFVDKRLRQLANSVGVCSTFFGRLTLARFYPPEIIEKSEDSSEEYHRPSITPKLEWFVQSDYIRSLYDSYQILESIRSRAIQNELEPSQLLKQLGKYILEDSELLKNEEAKN